MSKFKVSLDKYLTTEPEDNFTPWCEQVVELIDEGVYKKHENWIVDSSECNEWLNDIYNRNVSPEHAAKVIERILKYR